MLGSLPGVVAGAIVRVELLSGGTAFLLVVAAVLVPLGAWLLLPARFLRHEGRNKGTARPPAPPARFERHQGRNKGTALAGEEGAARVGAGKITAMALVVGVVGGIYGIGGGSILAPILVGLGFGVAEVAPAALAATFLTSVAGLATFGLLSLGGDGEIAPDWTLGLALGLAGLGGSYLGAVLQPRLPELFLRRLLGLLALAVGLRYVFSALF